MGESLGDTGTYGVFVPNSAEELQPEQTGDLAEAASRHGSSDGREKDGKPIVGARRLEWRTPPLWGVRDSAPYLHDGRAATLEQAIALHDGEAREATRRFFRLSPKERLQVVSFLKSLVAPDQVAAAR
jgi:cytochrome c peroxidase